MLYNFSTQWRYLLVRLYSCSQLHALSSRLCLGSALQERGLGRSNGKKNFFRTALTILCGVISIVGASDLDKFVALIGSFACVPLVYIYPALLHYKGVAKNRLEKGLDAVIMLVGLAAYDLYYPDHCIKLGKSLEDASFSNVNEGI